jgi:hypothetical protein
VPGTTRFNEALFDSDAFGFDIDQQVYVNPNAIEKNLLRAASPRVVRSDDPTLKRAAAAKLVRRNE